MSYQLSADQIMEALVASGNPNAAALQTAYESLVTGMATTLAVSLGIDCGRATFEGLDFAGTCVPFRPAFDGQPLPEMFAEHGFDEAEEWT